MGTFGPGILLDDTTMRPVSGRVLEVLEVGTDLPLVSDPPVVVTSGRGYYGQFTVADKDAVLLKGGGADEVIAAVDRSPGGVSLFAGTSATFADLPPAAAEGEVYLVADTQHAWARLGGAWVDTGSIKGPAGTTTWGGITNKPSVVLTINGIGPDAAGNVTVEAVEAVEAGSVRFVRGSSSVSRGTTSQDVCVIFLVPGATAPVNAISGLDIWMRTL